MNTFLIPSLTDNTPVDPFARGGLIDQMFNATFPWKMLQAFTPKNTQVFDFLPSLDVKSDAKQYTLSAEIPGVASDNVKIEVHDHVLTISGEKKAEEKKEDEKKQWHVSERSFGSFSRTMTLPEDADLEHITAQQKDGVLTVTVPRATQTENKKMIEITTA
jgi:HSP20 family protein